MDGALEVLGATDIQKSHGQICCRLNIKTGDEWKGALQLMSELSATSWNVYKTFPNPERYRFRRQYVCHHNQYRKKSKGWKTDTKCPAVIDVKIKITSVYVRCRDKLVDSYPCILLIKGIHNHPLKSADALGQLKLSDRTKATVFKHFESGLTASQVHNWFQLDLLAEDVSYLANNYINPKPRSLYYCWDLWRRQTCGAYVGDEMLNAIQSYAKTSDADIAVKRFGKSSFVCVIITPLMIRVHQQMKQAGETVFIDTTSHVDQTNCSVTILLCTSPIGALPLGVVVSSGQDEECYYQGFSLFKERIGACAFFGSTPNVFMTDDSKAEKNALSSIWPTSTQLLCIFHVLQAVWRWLMNPNHGVKKDVRQTLLLQFKDILYSSTVDQASSRYQKLVDCCTDLNCGQFAIYIGKLMERRSEWCFADRQHLILRGHNTNNFAEATIRVIKDVVFSRCKAYNACHVVRLIVDIFSPYMQARLMNAALGKTKPCLVNAPTLAKEMITKLSEFQYEVVSESKESIVYRVDVETATCTCPTGGSGKICKHTRSVLVHNYLQSEYLFSGTAKEKHKLAVIALGAVEAPPLEYFQDLLETSGQQLETSENQRHDTTDLEIGNEEPCASEVIEPVVSHHTHAQSGGNSPNQPNRSASNLQLFNDIVDLMKTNTDMGSSETETALLKCKSMLQRIKSTSQMNSYYHKNIESIPHRNFGRKIRVQPTAIARRPAGTPRGIAALGKGRRPTSIPCLPLKRKRSLAHNVNLNQGNAKSH